MIAADHIKSHELRLESVPSARSRQVATS